MEETNVRPYPKSMHTAGVQLVFTLTVPVFFLVFNLLYRPSGLEAYLDMGRGLFPLNLLVISLICLAVLALARRAAWKYKERMPFEWKFMLLCDASEIVMVSLFSALYLTLVSKGSCHFLGTLLRCQLWFVSVLVYPYVIVALLIPLSEEDLPKLLQSDNTALSTIKFYDDKGHLKMVLDSSVILYVRADENYVRVNYVENGRRQDFSMRASMQSLEKPMTEKGILRCHRSFYINPTFIKELRKGRDGNALAKLKMDNLDNIPVSKKYYDTLIELL